MSKNITGLNENIYPTNETLLYTYSSTEEPSFFCNYKSRLDNISNSIASINNSIRVGTGESYVIVDTTADEILNGNNLLSVISGIQNDTPYNKERKQNNKKTVLLPPAVYNLNGQKIIINSGGINIIGLGSAESTIIYYSGTTEDQNNSQILIYNEDENFSIKDISISNLTLFNDKTPKGIYIPAFWIGGNTENLTFSNLIITGLGTGTNLYTPHLGAINGKETAFYIDVSFPNINLKLNNIKSNGSVSPYGGTAFVSDLTTIKINNSEIITNSYFLFNHATSISTKSLIEFNNCKLIGSSGLELEDACAYGCVQNYSFNNCYISGTKIKAYAIQGINDETQVRTTYSGKFSNCTIHGTIEGFGAIIDNCYIKSSNSSLPAVFVNMPSGITDVTSIGVHHLKIMNSTLIGGTNCPFSLSGLSPFSHSLTMANCQINKPVTGFFNITTGYVLTNTSLF